MTVGRARTRVLVDFVSLRRVEFGGRKHSTVTEHRQQKGVDRVLRYVATERDEVEGWFPPIPDHWTSYALAEITTWVWS